MSNVEADKIGQAIGNNYGTINQTANSPDKPESLPNSIPSISNFVGRKDYLDDLRQSHQNGTRCFVLHGTGGVGKTALALQFAGEIAGQYKAKVFVEMQGMSENPLSARDAMFNIIRQFGHDVPADVSDAQLSGLFRQLAQSQPTLIVLDNAKNKQSVEALKQARACFIITSREAFTLTEAKGGKKIYQMSAEDARNLLFELAGENRFEGRADELAELAGYLPMSLKPLASILAEDALETIGDIIGRYRDTQKLFEEHVPDYSLTLEETLTVGASFELSYKILPDELKQNWRRLSVFPSDFDEAAIAAVLNIPAEEARQTQTQLRKFNLLEVTPETRRFNLHDLTRAFTGTKLSADERFNTQLLFAKHYASILIRASKMQLNREENYYINALKLIDTEWSNITTGQKWAANEAEQNDEAANLCTDYSAYARDFVTLRLHGREDINWLESGLLAARKLNTRQNEGNRLCSLGVAYETLGEYRKAIEYHEQALYIHREISDRRNEGADLTNLGLVYNSLGEYQKAIEYLEQAVEISREIGNRLGEGSSLSNLGITYNSLGEYQKAIEYHEQYLEISREIGDRLGEGISLGNLGAAYDSLGEYRKAIEYQEQALAIKREIGNRLGEGISLGNLGSTYNSLGEKEKACGLWREAADILEAIESPHANYYRQRLKKNCES